MTEQEIKRLSRSELVQLVLDMDKTSEQLRQRIISMERHQREQALSVKKFGSIAESALQVSGIFEAAQQAADQYLEQASRASAAADQMKAEAEELLRRTRQECHDREQETLRFCEERRTRAEEEAQAYWQSLEQELCQRLEDYVPTWHQIEPAPVQEPEEDGKDTSVHRSMPEFLPEEHPLDAEEEVETIAQLLPMEDVMTGEVNKDENDEDDEDDEEDEPEAGELAVTMTMDEE